MSNQVKETIKMMNTVHGKTQFKNSIQNAWNCLWRNTTFSLSCRYFCLTVLCCVWVRSVHWEQASAAKQTIHTVYCYRFAWQCAHKLNTTSYMRRHGCSCVSAFRIVEHKALRAPCDPTLFVPSKSVWRRLLCRVFNGPGAQIGSWAAPFLTILNP